MKEVSCKVQTTHISGWTRSEVWDIYLNLISSNVGPMQGWAYARVEMTGQLVYVHKFVPDSREQLYKTFRPLWISYIPLTLARVWRLLLEVDRAFWRKPVGHRITLTFGPKCCKRTRYFTLWIVRCNYHPHLNLGKTVKFLEIKWYIFSIWSLD